MQAEEKAKQQKFVESTRDIHHHMLEQMREQEGARREQTELDQQLLRQRIIQDQKVAIEMTVKQSVFGDVMMTNLPPFVQTMADTSSLHHQIDQAFPIFLMHVFVEKHRN